jgi:hypothetical protein
MIAAFVIKIYEYLSEALIKTYFWRGGKESIGAELFRLNVFLGKK